MSLSILSSSSGMGSSFGARRRMTCSLNGGSSLASFAPPFIVRPLLPPLRCPPLLPPPPPLRGICPPFGPVKALRTYGGTNPLRATVVDAPPWPPSCGAEGTEPRRGAAAAAGGTPRLAFSASNLSPALWNDAAWFFPSRRSVPPPRSRLFTALRTGNVSSSSLKDWVCLRPADQSCLGAFGLGDDLRCTAVVFSPPGSLGAGAQDRCAGRGGGSSRARLAAGCGGADGRDGAVDDDARLPSRSRSFACTPASSGLSTFSSAPRISGSRRHRSSV